jgi:hypothetical protein
LIRFKKLFLLSLCGFQLLFTGCLEIIEDVTTHADGSGVFALTVNMSQSRTKINSLLLLDSINGQKVPGRPEILGYLDKVERTLIASKGISGVKTVRNMDNFIFSIKFNFDKDVNLNYALEAVNRALQPKARTPLGTVFLFNGSVFQRTESYFKNNIVKNIDNKGLAAFYNATYTGIYRFDRVVKNVSNTNSSLSPSGKAVMMKTYLPAIVKRTVSLANTIELK